MPSTLADRLDQVIEYFNRRTMDLPDGFFDRKTQFIINGATFESLLSPSTTLRAGNPNDPLVLMLARGPAGYRFTVKALQHAIPDAKIESTSTRGSGRAIELDLHLVGTLRGTGEKIDARVAVALRANDAGLIEVAEATVDQGQLEKIREARLRN